MRGHATMAPLPDGSRNVSALTVMKNGTMVLTELRVNRLRQTLVFVE